MRYNILLTGAMCGFLGAVCIDLDAWKRAPKDSKFEWDLAIKRWIAGAVIGVTAALSHEFSVPIPTP